MHDELQKCHLTPAFSFFMLKQILLIFHECKGRVAVISRR